MFGDTSAFKVLIDKDNYSKEANTQPDNRFTRTRTLLSGGGGGGGGGNDDDDDSTPHAYGAEHHTKQDHLYSGPQFRVPPPPPMMRGDRHSEPHRQFPEHRRYDHNYNHHHHRHQPQSVYPHGPHDAGGLSTSSASDTSGSGEGTSRRRRRAFAPSPPPPPSGALSDSQRRVMMDTIREYCPADMEDVVFEDVIQQMEELESQGHALPKNYDKRQHGMGDNELRLYEQQMKRDKLKDNAKVTNVLNFGALGLSWFCQSMAVDWIKTRSLPAVMKEAVDNGEFDDSLDGMGVYLRGTVFESPVLSTVLKFLEKVGEAHQLDIDQETDKQDEREERLAQSKSDALKSLQAHKHSVTATLKAPKPKRNTTLPPPTTTTTTVKVPTRPPSPPRPRSRPLPPTVATTHTTTFVPSTAAAAAAMPAPAPVPASVSASVVVEEKQEATETPPLSLTTELINIRRQQTKLRQNEQRVEKLLVAASPSAPPPPPRAPEVVPPLAATPDKGNGKGKGNGNGNGKVENDVATSSATTTAEEKAEAALTTDITTETRGTARFGAVAGMRMSPHVHNMVRTMQAPLDQLTKMMVPDENAEEDEALPYMNLGL
jgi:hypothetical protein